MSENETKVEASIEETQNGGQDVIEENTPENTTFDPDKYVSKEEFEKLQKELKQARFKLSKDRVEKKELKEKSIDNIPKDEIVEIVKEKLIEQEYEKMRDKISQTLPSEVKEKVDFYLDNVVKKSGNPEKDFEVAIKLVEAEKLKVENSELARVISNKFSEKKVNLAGDMPEASQTVKLSEKDKKLAEKFGLSEEDIKKRLSE